MIQRRPLILASAAALALAAIGLPEFAFAQSDKLKVAAVYTVPFEQQWVGRLHQAFKAAEARGEIEYKASENVSNADYERVMREYANAGNQLIVGEAFAVEAAARKVARDFPKTHFLLGSSGKPQAPNFSVFDNFIQEPAYLTGMIAGGMTKTNQIGMVGGFPIPEVNRLMNAFMAGAREVNGQAEFSVSFINSWFDPPKAKEAAFAMMEKGADVLYAERFGVSDAAKEKGKLAIGNVIDTQAQYPETVVASAIWNFEPTRRTRDQIGQGRQVHGRRLRALFDDGTPGLEPRAARHVRRQGAGRVDGKSQGPASRHASPASSTSKSTTASRNRRRSRRCATSRRTMKPRSSSLPCSRLARAIAPVVAIGAALLAGCAVQPAAPMPTPRARLPRRLRPPPAAGSTPRRASRSCPPSARSSTCCSRNCNRRKDTTSAA